MILRFTILGKTPGFAYAVTIKKKFVITYKAIIVLVKYHAILYS